MTARKYQRGLSDEELRVVARWIARSLLEVERGQRPAQALRAVFAPHLYYELTRALPSVNAPRVTSADIGAAAFSRLTTCTGYAVVIVREADGRWEALTMFLRRNKRHAWQLLDIIRASQVPQRTPPPVLRRGS